MALTQIVPSRHRNIIHIHSVPQSAASRFGGSHKRVGGVIHMNPGPYRVTLADNRQLPRRNPLTLCPRSRNCLMSLRPKLR
jgi:hypothetical protein